MRLINLWDLNNDGAVDLVFASTHEHNEKADLFLYWGRHGYSAERRSQLPTDGAKAVAAADLNGELHGCTPAVVAARTLCRWRWRV